MNVWSLNSEEQQSRGLPATLPGLLLVTGRLAQPSNPPLSVQGSPADFQTCQQLCGDVSVSNEALNGSHYPPLWPVRAEVARIELCASHGVSACVCMCAAELLLCYSIMVRCYFGFRVCRHTKDSFQPVKRKQVTFELMSLKSCSQQQQTLAFIKGLKADGKKVMLISQAEIRCLLLEVRVSYLILSSSAFFSSASLLSTVMMASCSSSVRWLRSIMAPPTGPPASLSRKVQKRTVAVNSDQPSSSLSDKKKQTKKPLFSILYQTNPAFWHKYPNFKSQFPPSTCDPRFSWFNFTAKFLILFPSDALRKHLSG